MANQTGKPGKPGKVEEEGDGLRIVKHGKQFRATVTIPLSTEDDADLIQHINAVPKEERQRALKDAMRGGLGYLSPNPERPVDKSEEILTRVNWLVDRVDWLSTSMEWLVAEVSKLPDWFVQQLAKVSIRNQSNVVDDVSNENTEGLLSEEDEKERLRNVKKRKW